MSGSASQWPTNLRVGWATRLFEYTALFLIRDFDEKAHLAGVRACLIELQDFERLLTLEYRQALR